MGEGDGRTTHGMITYPGDLASVDPGITNVLEDVDYVIDGAAKTGTLKKYSVTTDPNDTIRQQIIDVVDIRLKTILIANGYKTDVGKNVYAWRETPLDESLLPAIIYRDVSCDISPMGTDVIFHKMNLEIEIVCAAGSITPASAREIISDVVTAIGTDVQWSNLAVNTYLLSNEIQVEQNDKIIGGISMRFEIHFRTKEWDPYTRI